jgi:AcrR family transcriptional regulator
MAEDIAGKGDPLKSLQLMWGKAEVPKRGPKARASVEDLVAAAIAIADADGLDAVSTRRVADAVGISPMSFYTHIPGKAELFDLMLDAVAGWGGARPDFRPEHWRENLAFVARTLRGFYLAHPWVLQLSTHRPVLGPNTLMAYDVALSAVDGVGLDEIEMDMTFTLIANYVYGAVRDEARWTRVTETTGMSDDEWWYRVAPFLETLDYSPYPVAARVGPVTGEAYGVGDPARAFEFGLERVLDGIGLFIEKKRGHGASPVSG